MESSYGRATSELAPRRPRRRLVRKLHGPREALMLVCRAAPSAEWRHVLRVASQSLRFPIVTHSSLHLRFLYDRIWLLCAIGG